jgi:hypothetical protein
MGTVGWEDGGKVASASEQLASGTRFAPRTSLGRSFRLCDTWIASGAAAEYLETRTRGVPSADAYRQIGSIHIRV